MKKKLSVILAVVILLVSILSLSITAENGAPSLEVLGHNLTLENNIYIVYYVIGENIPTNAEHGLLLWHPVPGTYPAEYRYDNADVVMKWDGNKETIGGVTYERYEYRDIAAKMMSDDIYVRPYVKEIDGTITYGNVDKYSVLQYMWAKQGTFSAKSTFIQ